MNKVYEHTVQTANVTLKEKGLADLLEVVAVDKANSTVTLRDKDYGDYKVDFKALCPKSSVPSHRLRKRQAKIKVTHDKMLGKSVLGRVIVEIFYGPDRGYKNRSMYLTYRNPCGHEGVTTYALLVRHKKAYDCGICERVDHGERQKVDGVLKKRSYIYIRWVALKKQLASEYAEFSDFKKATGEYKPAPTAKIVVENGTPVWAYTKVAEEAELNLIATAIRQAFRHHDKYKKCVQDARVETDKGPRYRCAACLQLFKIGEVQVDHIDPIASISGAPMDKRTLIDTICTDKIQVLDRKCHSKKSMAENELRKKNKKNLAR